ncbi:2'-5' RNA ligase, partial [Marivirga lumbricoides]
MQKELFFIGICPPNPLKEEIHGLKIEFGQKYDTKGAFRSSAHITLQMPFKLGTNKLEAL